MTEAIVEHPNRELQTAESASPKESSSTGGAGVTAIGGGEEHVAPTFPVRLRWALVLCVVWHGGLLLMGSFESTYDAWIHIFLGDHYQRDWFSTWDQRWYTGFTTISYPPGSHMSIAAVAALTGSLTTAFISVQVFALLNLTVGVYRFSKLWVGDRAATNAALLLIGSSAIAETVHLFGQLPTILSLGFLLNALPFMNRWVFQGNVTDLMAGVVTMAATTAAHHVTTLFGSIFFLGPVLVYGLIECSRVSIDGEEDPPHPRVTLVLFLPLVARRLRRIVAPTVRIAILGPLVLAALIVVVLPYWYWSATDPIVQIPIPHGSRADFLEDRNLGLVFFVIPWGLMLLALPYALVRAVVDRKWPLAASIGLLALLGTGGTTPLPKLLLGPAFEILTLDRFTFWAAIMILPLAGQLADSVERGAFASWGARRLGWRLMAALRVGLVLAIIAMSLFAATLSRHREFQPEPIAARPIVDFLEKDQHDRWRFLTLGFGDQMAWISAQTTATQVDGNYHSVRRLPELTSTSVERLEGAKYRGISGLGSLQQFLEVPEKYNLKFVFSNDQFYDPLLFFSGWQRLGPLENGVVVWERADIPPLPAQLPTREVPRYQRLMWGTIPPTALVLGTIQVSIWAFGRPANRRRGNRARNDRRILVGPFRWLDSALGRSAARLEADHRAQRRPDPQLLAAGSRHWPQRLGVIQSPLTRSPLFRPLLSTVVVGALILPLALWTVGSDRANDDPGRVVESYYDHLDFRRWPEAHELLDPTTRPDYDLWRLRTSADGGVLASYAKLDQMATETISLGARPERPETAVVRVDLRYLTAIDWYAVTEEVELVLRDGHWRIVEPDPDLTVPPDRLVRRANIDYLLQGRRRILAAGTELADIQDRPELWVSHARLVLDEGRPVIVGEVVNLDVDPADITLTGILRGVDNQVVLRYNAAQHVNHRLLPRESTSFRISFEEVAAGGDVDFDPLDFNPARFDPETMVTAELYAKGVVTGEGLYRGVSVNRAEVVVADGDGAVRLVGELRNDGVVEATIPMVLVTFLDADGRVKWVENYFVDSAIRSQRSQPFSIELPIDRIGRLTEAVVDVDRYHNGSIPEDAPSPSPPPILTDLPAGLPFASIRLDVVNFSEAPS